MGIFADRGYNLEESKNVMLQEIEQWYGSRVLDTFDSSVLGKPYRYYCAESDQLRMLNGKVSNVSMTLMCGAVPSEPDTDPTYNWLEHTSTECGKLHTEYVQFSKAVSAKRVQLIAATNAATSVAQVDALFDEMVAF